jgi:AraC family transcriptional regulator
MALTEKAEPFIRFLHKTKKADGRTSVQKELALRKQDQPGSKRWKLREVTCREYVKAINTAVHFIKEHLQEKISLRDLAETVHISGFHFHRIFKAIQGECPGRYIQRLRMEKALSGLTANRTLAEIAEQTGYQSPHALSKAFRKYYGISPSEWRKYPQYPVGGKTAVDPESFA